MRDGLLAIPMLLSFCSFSKENPGSGALGRWQLKSERKNMCGTWVSGLEPEAGWAVGGGGKARGSSGQACGPEWKVGKRRPGGGESGLAIGVCHCLGLCRSPDSRTLGLYTTRV